MDMEYSEYKKIHNRLREFRIAAGFRPHYVARVLGFKDTSKLSRWENASCFPNLVNAFRLLGVYGGLVDQAFEELRRSARRDIMDRMSVVGPPTKRDLLQPNWSRPQNHA